MNKSIIDIQNLCYKYGDGTCALEDVSLKIGRGQTTAVLGGNGAGKSTLLKTFNGILKPTSGNIYFDGKPLDYTRKNINELRKSVGMVFQDPDSQLFSASVYQDISFGAINLGLPTEEIRRRVDSALDKTGISHLREKPTHCLSYGQKKRAAIAGVLVMEPKLIVLDEPTAGLDPIGASALLNLLKLLQEDLGITVVISTHDIDIVPLFCDMVYIMNKGKVVLAGTPDEVFKEAKFLRSINLRLPRIGHLMEILKDKDGFEFENTPVTISEARKALKRIYK